jgi:chemotaxis protein methyltransferase WspC
MGILQQQGFAAVPHPRAFACRRRADLPALVPAVDSRTAKPVPAAVAPAAVPAKPVKQERPPAAALPANGGPPPAGEIRALHGRALALADQGRFAEAEALCRESLSRERPRADVYCLLGLIHEAARRPAEAEESYLKALYLDPGHYESLIQLGLLYRRQGNDRKARIYLRRAETQEGRADGTDGP